MSISPVNTRHQANHGRLYAILGKSSAKPSLKGRLPNCWQPTEATHTHRRCLCRACAGDPGPLSRS
jgi:hypothetical protein